MSHRLVKGILPTKRFLTLVAISNFLPFAQSGGQFLFHLVSSFGFEFAQPFELG